MIHHQRTYYLYPSHLRHCSDFSCTGADATAVYFFQHIQIQTRHLILYRSPPPWRSVDRLYGPWTHFIPLDLQSPGVIDPNSTVPTSTVTQNLVGTSYRWNEALLYFSACTLFSSSQAVSVTSPYIHHIYLVLSFSAKSLYSMFVT
jgi:hypothetical protein